MLQIMYIIILFKSWKKGTHCLSIFFICSDWLMEWDVSVLFIIYSSMYEVEITFLVEPISAAHQCYWLIIDLLTLSYVLFSLKHNKTASIWLFSLSTILHHCASLEAFQCSQYNAHQNSMLGPVQRLSKISAMLTISRGRISNSSRLQKINFGLTM